MSTLSLNQHYRRRNCELGKVWVYGDLMGFSLGTSQ